MIGAMVLAIAATVSGADGAAQAGNIISATGERVESGFWTTVNELLLKIPNLIGFLFAIIAAWFVGRLMARSLRRQMDRRGKTDLGRLLAAVVVGVTIFIVGMFALTLLFPSIDTGTVLSLLGVGSIAIGFAFKDIAQNLAAGVILLIREPYKTGDEIVVGDDEYAGVVEEVEMRATHIRTTDQRLVVIPNVKIFNDAVTVNTDCDHRLTTYTLSIAYGGDPRRAMEIVREAIKSTDGVRSEPPPQIAITALNDYSIDLLFVYAAGAAEPEQIRVKGAVLLSIHDACRANGIELPFPTQVHLLRPYGDGSGGPDKLEASRPRPKPTPRSS